MLNKLILHTLQFILDKAIIYYGKRQDNDLEGALVIAANEVHYTLTDMHKYLPNTGKCLMGCCN